MDNIRINAVIKKEKNMTTKSKKNVENLEKALTKSTLVDSAEQLELLIERVKKAQKLYSTFSQEKVDAIFKAAATAADKARIPLARMAVEETAILISAVSSITTDVLPGPTPKAGLPEE